MEATKIIDRGINNMPDPRDIEVADHKMRRFQLFRHEDPSGVSGVGIIAEGTVFSDGTVVVHWLSDWRTTEIFHDEGLISLEEIHGHDGKTVIVWIDEGKDEWIPLGDGVEYQETCDPNDPFERPTGILITHDCDINDTCLADIPFDVLENIDLPDPKWVVQSYNPLSISPSVHLKECGLHGFITGGQWRDCSNYKWDKKRQQAWNSWGDDWA